MVSSKTGKLWLIGCTFFISAVASFYYIGCKPNFLIGQQSFKLLMIPSGTTFRQLKDKLIQEKYIACPYTFILGAYLIGYTHHVKPGAYKIQANMNNIQVLKLLVGALQEPIRVVLNAVANKKELSAKITQNISLFTEDFDSLLNDSVFLASYGFTPDNILAMFIPNTYEFYWTIAAEALFKKMYFEYQKFWNKERLERAQAISLTSIQVYILASIVAKETTSIIEYPIIAGVYINRLKKNMFLQACPTALYAANTVGARRVLYEYVRFDSPYNTYRYKGLPPGPITMPPISVIDAVLYYQEHDYLFFSSTDPYSNNHRFATTFAQHQQYVRQYRKYVANNK